MATQAVQTPRKPGGFRAFTHAFNRFVLPLAGTRLVPLYGVVEHRGRRSGKTYRTPVVVRPTADGFVVPLPWGDTTDWCRNIRAAGSCTLRWNGRDYALADPEVVDDPTAARALFGAAQRPFMALFGIERCLRLRRPPSTASRPSPGTCADLTTPSTARSHSTCCASRAG